MQPHNKGLTTIQTHQHTTRTTADDDRNRGRLNSRSPGADRSPRPTQQPQPRSRPLPAADSEEATPCEPDLATTRSQSASPRLLEGGSEMKARAADA